MSFLFLSERCLATLVLNYQATLWLIGALQGKAVRNIWMPKWKTYNSRKIL